MKLKRDIYIYIIIKLILKKEERKLGGIIYLSLYAKTLSNLRILSDLTLFKSKPSGFDFNNYLPLLKIRSRIFIKN